MVSGAVSTVRRIDWRAMSGGGAVFQGEGFRKLWLGRVLSHTATNAVLFALLVQAVGGTEDASSMKSALFITAYILPTATLGTISGVFVDRLPKNIVLSTINVARVGLMLLLLMGDASLWTIYGVALLLAVTSQFGTPAEAATLPRVVTPDQLTSATSANQFAGLIAQVLGLTILAPIFLNTVGGDPLYFVAALLYGAGAAFFFTMPVGEQHDLDVERTVDSVREVRKQFAQAWDTLGRDLQSYMSVIIAVLASTASLVAVTLMPQFVQDVLDIPVQNSVYVFLPSAIGIVLGLRLVGVLERRVAKMWLTTAGFLLFMASLACLTLTTPTAAFLSNMLSLNEEACRIIVVVLLSTAGTFSFAVLGVSSRSLVHERMPVELQGRIFAAQHVLANLASIGPILFVGLLAEVFAVEPVMLLMVLVILSVAGWTAARAAARPGLVAAHDQ
jgi:Na+/melibiose symporter-like transporter